MFRRLFCLTAFLAFAALPSAAHADERADLEKWVSSLQQYAGKSTIDGEAATIDLPDAYRFIKKDDAQKIISEIWGNPPDKTILGLIVPKGFSPLDSHSWAVVIRNDPSGYVSDSDASTIDYDKMLSDLKSSEPEINEERKKEGFEPVHIVGWATRPYYDASAHKLHWAKELEFEGDKVHTLNYAVRILGRHGLLELNAIAGMNQMPQIEAAMPAILSSVNYQEGNRYTDFDPKIDKVAGYGIAALVAGGIAAKAGLFKGLLVGLLALKKFVIMGALAAAAFFKKIFGRFFGKKPDQY